MRRTCSSSTRPIGATWPTTSAGTTSRRASRPASSRHNRQVRSRKQRRRREKLQRHESEYVMETEDGDEIPVERPVERAPGNSKKPAKATASGRGRQVPKPSLARVAKRTAIFAPVILLVVFLTAGKEATMGAKVFTAVTLLAFF